MMLVIYEKTRTFRLCSIYFFCIMIPVKSFGSDEEKDVVFVSDERVFQKHYRFEDFFWTGSEDDLERETSLRNDTDLEISLLESSPFETWKTTTVFHTTTIFFATVYPNIESCKSTESGCTLEVSPVKTSSIEFSLPTFIPEASDILPCPTQTVSQTDGLKFTSIFSNGIDSTVSVEATTVGAPKNSTPKNTKPERKPESESVSPEINNRNNATITTVFPTIDQKYWIMTVLRNDNISQNLELNLTESKLTMLYKKALQRRQEKYFGREGYSDRKENKLPNPVKVDILNVTKSSKVVEILYYVSVAGEPVPAVTASNDMRLITASEVIAELGYPILSKAEPYIKNIVPLGARVKGRTRDTWLLIGSVIAAVLLLIILATLFALGLSKKQTKHRRAREMERKKPDYEEEKGDSNPAFEDDELSGKVLSKFGQKSQTKGKSFQNGNQSTATSIKFTTEDRRGSTTSSSCSGSSEASLVRLRHQQRRTEKILKEKEDKPKPKPRTRVRKIDNSECSKNYERHSLEGAFSRNTYKDIAGEEHDYVRCSSCMMKSPTSYLSMPSVRDFPRGTQIPEPLSKVLEPISIRHFDADSDSTNEHPYTSQVRHKVDIEQICEIKNKSIKKNILTRHASLEGDDPGFIGPVVWNKHCQKIGEKEKGIHVVEVEENVNTGRMKKRFNELLDDALSMFGSRNPSPEGIEGDSVKQLDSRVHSAVVRPARISQDYTPTNRPKTTGSRRPQSALISGPKGAWETPSCSTLSRPDTATVFKKLSSPTIDKDLIIVNSELGPSDPAIPLIAAIKNELKKFEDPSANE